MLSVRMGRKTLFYGAIALILPFLLFCAASMVKNKTVKKLSIVTVLAAYACGIIYVTLAGRSLDHRLINLTPLWTYRLTSDPQFRWQGYMNVFLFLPFGFMLGFVTMRNFWQSLLIGLAFSVGIEAVQYVFSLGMCELDDVFHNTLGTALGYGYYKALSWLKAKHGQRIRAGAHQATLYVRRLGNRGLGVIKTKLKRGKK